MNTKFTVSGIAIEIHFFDNDPKEMMVFLPDYNKTYFVSVLEHSRQLKTMSCKWLGEVELAIHKFLTQS